DDLQPGPATQQQPGWTGHDVRHIHPVRSPANEPRKYPGEIEAVAEWQWPAVRPGRQLADGDCGFYVNEAQTFGSANRDAQEQHLPTCLDQYACAVIEGRVGCWIRVLHVHDARLPLAWAQASLLRATRSNSSPSSSPGSVCAIRSRS